VIHVISTGLNAPTKDRCIASVASQTFPHFHRYIEAANFPHICALENFTIAARDLYPDSIIVSLDGDDWFPHDRVLEHVNRIYADPNIWMTYGSFVHADGRPGFASLVPEGENVRTGPWRMTHLKTFRAALFQKLTDADLQRDGKFLDLAWDHAVMLPLAEVAGHEHRRFVSDVMYTYSYATSWERAASSSERLRELETARHIRGRASKGRLVAL
jgi:glycosyltransferase involved in cell wall biosynthesis